MRRRPGRPSDHSRDAEILRLALDALAEADYDHLTLDAVATRVGRAKTTLYRRWPSKEALVLAAVQAVGRPPEADQLPDAGSLRQDLLAVVDSPWLGGPVRRLAVFGGLASAARVSPAVADAVRATVSLPYVQLYRDLLERAVRRGEVSSEHLHQLPVLAQVVPALSSQQLEGGAILGRAYFVDVVDHVVLPALGVGPVG
ncbi:DNA-binding transcriptional regulator, AcrR family [Microlunatus flavus]|uniref:DNA-binding transcriptional regulator, AcrR family n=1 Tax=Microlunatus flavus TaxID=1036181 RepID=A0A1H9B7I5_9ACTN|nr:DNA-binding transcriptional regulator, AcrR family [Microlunatus flavus]